MSFLQGFNEGAKWARKMCVKRIRKKCIVCKGSGYANDNSGNECEYCGRPIALIKQLDHLESRSEEGGGDTS